MTFGSPAHFRSAEPRAARVGTPLGSMIFGVVVEDTSPSAFETFLGGADVELHHCEDPSATVELLLLPFWPKLPEGMRVDGGVAALWRASAKKDGAELVFRAVWEPGARSEDGGGNTGEHLTALTWYAPDVQVSLGTSDEAALSDAARSGFLPERLAPAFADERAHYARFVDERDGLEIVLPPLLTGETVQVHMALAWKTGQMDEYECSPWFAVDVSPQEIVRMVDEALRPSG